MLAPSLLNTSHISALVVASAGPGWCPHSLDCRPDQAQDIVGCVGGGKGRRWGHLLSPSSFLSSPGLRVPSIISGFPSTSGQTNLRQNGIEYMPVSVGKSLLVPVSKLNCPGRWELSGVTLLVLSKHTSSGHGGL